jgi:hypothetical protein
LLSDLDASSTDSSLASRSDRRSKKQQDFVFSSSSFAPLPVEAPINTKLTQEAIEQILPSAIDLVQTTPANEIFHEEPNTFHTMDTQIEKALLSTFISDEKEMEKALGIASSCTDAHQRDFADALMDIVNEEQTLGEACGNPSILGAPSLFAPALNNAISTGAPGNSSTLAAGVPGVPPLPSDAVSEFNFPRKVYRMLDDAERNPSYHAIVSWVEEGMGFQVHNKKQFVDMVLPIYFDMTQYASFRRQLNMYSFERKGTSTYTNPFFVQGCPDLLDKITRKSGSSSSNGSKK